MEDYGYDMNPGMDQGEQQVSSDQTSEENALDIINDLADLNQLDQRFKDVFKDVINLDDKFEVFSSGIQKLEVNNLVSIMNGKTKESETEEMSKVTEDLNTLLNTNTNDILKLFNDSNIQNNRKKLYDLYNEISEINPIAYRMLKVYVDNILVRNMQTKQFLNVMENENSINNIEIPANIKKIVQNFIKMIIVYFDLQNKLKNNILPNTLKHGDYYVEVIDLSPVSRIIETKRELITESIILPSKRDESRSTIQELSLGYIEFPVHQIEETEVFKNPKNATPGERMSQLLKNKNIEEADIGFLYDILGLEQEENPHKEVLFNFDKFQDLDFNCLKDIHIKLLEPANVIKIEQDGINFGYLIIEDIEDNGDGDTEEINLYQRFASDDGSASGKNKNIDTTKEISQKFTKEIIKKVTEYIQEKNRFIDDLPEELQLSLKVILYEKIKENAKLKFRFLEPDKLVNFHTNIDKYAPYATSIFDPITLPVKLYTVALMSSVISRLSRASVLRKWNIEVGNRRNHTQIVENVKKELKSKNITFDDLSSMKNISQILTDFRDIATVTKNGQKFIDLELMPMQDRALPINDLQDLRNELIAATGIPSVYLNIGDQAEQRETLVNLNIGFANSIASYQSYTEDGLNHLLNIIFKIVLKANGYQNIKDFNLSQYFRISMNPPLVLQLQNAEAMISTTANIIGILNQAQIQVNPIDLFKTYIPNINWDKIEKSGAEAIKNQMKAQLMQQAAPQAQEGQ